MAGENDWQGQLWWSFRTSPQWNSGNSSQNTNLHSSVALLILCHANFATLCMKQMPSYQQKVDASLYCNLTDIDGPAYLISSTSGLMKYWKHWLQDTDTHKWNIQTILFWCESCNWRVKGHVDHLDCNTLHWNRLGQILTDSHGFILLRWSLSSCRFQERGEDWNAATQTQLCFEFKTFLLAGHETSAAMLTWTLFELTQHPDALHKVQCS